MWTYLQFDKLSQAWIQLLPTPSIFLSGPVFREAMAAHLCLLAPCCQNKLGHTFGPEGGVVDPFGDHVMCAKLPFDTLRHRYDDCIVALVERANYPGVEVEAEVFGFYRDLIPARAMGEGGSWRW